MQEVFRIDVIQLSWDKCQRTWFLNSSARDSDVQHIRMLHPTNANMLNTEQPRNNPKNAAIYEFLPTNVA